MHAEIKIEDCNNGVLCNTSYALCEQIRVIPIDLVHKKICDVNDEVLERIRNCLMIAMGYQKQEKYKVV